ncbi:OmpH family outer membrane protein [Terrimonas ferruginea]|uniref:OmpH family outer membrane protein n=1 Tax=Terrimonas ferruginea TaxID=249 RepID=UPI000404E728|nr:OmpH family outer membrane protein [Terrimonas ferruginea]
MKNLSLVLNVVLLIAVGVLFFLFFNSGRKDAAAHRQPNKDSATANKPFRIAYFEMDSVQEHSEMVKDVKAEMNKEEEGINAQLNNLVRSYQEKRSGYQARQEKGQMTPDDLNRAMEDLQATEQSIAQKRQQLEQSYGEKVTQRNLTMRKKIEEFIAEYNKNSGFTYIIADEPGIFYYKDSSFNITADVISGLNDKYRSEKGKDKK